MMLLLLLALVVIAVIRAITQRRSVAPSEMMAADQESQHLLVKQNTVLRYMRAGTAFYFHLALQDLAFLRFYREDVVAELALAIARQGAYAGAAFLDEDRFRSRLCRFLHLMVERNRRTKEGRIHAIRMVPFEEIHDDCTYCETLAPEARWWERFWQEFSRLLAPVFRRTP